MCFDIYLVTCGPNEALVLLGKSLTSENNFREVKMCFDIGIVTCGPNEALVVSGMGYGEIDPDTKEYRPFVVMGRHFHN